MKLLRAVACVLILGASARAEPMDFAAIAPLSGRYVGPITCKDFEADFSVWTTKRWEEDFLLIDIGIDKTRKVCEARAGHGCGSYPDGAIGKVFSMKEKGEGLYRLEGKVPTRLGEIPMLGVLKIVDDPKGRNVKTFELEAASTGPPGGAAFSAGPAGGAEGASAGGAVAAVRGRYTVKAHGKAFKTPPRGMHWKTPNEPAYGFEFLSWEGEINLPDMKSACKGTSQKRVWLFIPPSSIYDSSHPGKKPPLK